jgi:hypothetical protein
MAASDFNDRIRFGSLFEIYGALLTKKQQECLELYFCEDYSLAEIADVMRVSRQAIHDLLKRVEQTLEHYEEMLGFLRRMEKTRMLTEEAEALLEDAAEAGSYAKNNRPGSKESDIKLARLREILQELQEESR